ncbi:methyltransferase TRM13-domain-containing protein [Tribonema minus]|uniref:tRNA:m(4)X modification enzyme TRM13 n=1 Tax=Tribonema minus TaxID=303371 RepID=A0A835ZI09_9STRA|nr:methyltransferase TRM13-domain-containing protein [Tribonema minus]
MDHDQQEPRICEQPHLEAQPTGGTPPAEGNVKPLRISKKAQRKLAKKDAGQDSQGTGDWDGCRMWVTRKNRYCSQPRKRDAQYCGLHQQEVFDAESRIPCPVDATHSIDKANLQWHLKICTFTKTASDVASQVFYSKGINSGPPLAGSPIAAAADVAAPNGSAFVDPASDPTAADEAPVIDASAVWRMAKASGGDIGGEYLSDLIARIERAYEEHVGSISALQLSPPECEPLKEAADAVKMDLKRMRHIVQQSSIIGHMQRRGMVQPEHCYIEMGAGRGLLGLALGLTYPDSDILLVDGAKPRNAGDKGLRAKGNPPFRAKVDIRDLDAGKLPLPQGKRVVIVAKHLCGVGTDLALRAALTLAPAAALNGQARDHSGGGGGSGASDCGGASNCGGGSGSRASDCGSGSGSRFAAAHGLAGVAIATCCHHCVNLTDYVGRAFAERCGFDKRDFAAIGRLGGWATTFGPEGGGRRPGSSSGGGAAQREGGGGDGDGDGDGDGGNEHSASDSGIGCEGGGAVRTDAERREIGRKSKALIDWGRKEYLEGLGMEAELVYFCDRAFSPENCLLLAWLPGGKMRYCL